MSSGDSNPRASKQNVEVFGRDAAAGGYVYAQGDRLSSRRSNERMTRAILAALDFRGRRVLDLGCGDGTYTLELLRRGGAAEVLGVDPAQAAIERARANAQGGDGAGVRYEVGNIYDLGGFGRHEVAVLRGVLHHLPDPAAAVASAFGSADELVILEPNGLNPVLKLIERLSAYHRAHEEQSFLPGRIDAWIRAGGGEVVARRFINFVPMFCPDLLARGLGALEPAIEATPLLRRVACGQYVVRGRRTR